MIENVFQVRGRGFFEFLHACDKVAPDLLTLDEPEVVVMQGELDAGLEGFVDCDLLLAPLLYLDDHECDIQVPTRFEVSIRMPS